MWVYDVYTLLTILKCNVSILVCLYCTHVLLVITSLHTYIHSNSLLPLSNTDILPIVNTKSVPLPVYLGHPSPPLPLIVGRGLWVGLLE